MSDQPATPVEQRKGLTIGDLTRNRETIASRDYVRQVAQDLRHVITPGDVETVADYIGTEIERVGGSDARLVFTVEDGTGPYCSWCWAIGGLCPHIAGGQSEHVQNEEDDRG